MNDGPGEPVELDDDYASMLASLQEQLPPETLRLAVGARGHELSWISAGHAPRPAVAERLRMLHDLARRSDLSDPAALLSALGAHGATGLAPLRILARSRYRWALLAFVAIDALVVVGVLVYAFR